MLHTESVIQKVLDIILHPRVNFVPSVILILTNDLDISSRENLEVDDKR